MNFNETGLIEPITKAVEQLGYSEMTPVQEKCIPPLLEHRDIIGCAQTGTGKTAAFALPILQNLSYQSSKKIRALVLTPTRELAIQIFDNFKAYGQNLPIKSGVVYGGVGQNPQVDMLRRGVDVLIATPGRLWDLMGQGYIKLSGVEIFVLDEADRMLDMGFIDDVKRIIKKLPAERQTLLFSATIPPEIEKLADSILKNPEKVMVNPANSTVDIVNQSVYFIDRPNKKKLLSSLLKSENVHSALVFVKTKHGADRVVRDLAGKKIRAVSIHGDKSQTARQKALNDFKSGKVRVMVATDIAARGLDISELSHVFNYDMPDMPETYIHRIGRTGRAGLGGEAVSFCDFDEMEMFQEIERHIGKRMTILESEWPMTIFYTSAEMKEDLSPGPAYPAYKYRNQSGSSNRNQGKCNPARHPGRRGRA